MDSSTHSPAGVPQPGGAAPAGPGRRGDVPASAGPLAIEAARLADICVKCGLCLPHCPTYAFGRIEGESPRGRIALVQGLASGELEAGAGWQGHLDNCLGCRNCERVCPAKVPYGELLDVGRAAGRAAGAGPAAPRLMALVATRPALLGLARGGLRLARATGLSRLLRGPLSAGWIGRALARMPLAPPAWVPARLAPAPWPTAGTVIPGETAGPAMPGETAGGAAAAPATGPRATVWLHGGCVARVMDSRSLADAARVLAALGYAVEIPRDQACCGAIHAHAGELDAARRLADRNLRAFEGEGPVVSLASGCGATLLDYHRLGSDPDAGRALGGRVTGIERLVNAALGDGSGTLTPLAMTIALHQPCTQRNVTGGFEETVSMLERIPGIEVRVLDPATGCCGAAGHHFLTRPEMADALAAPIVEEIRGLEPDAVASSNIGCALHLGACRGEARGRGPEPVLHPVSLVAMSLGLRGGDG